MNEATRNELDIVAEQIQSLRGLLSEIAAKLRGGEDAEGIDGIWSAVSELEKLVESDQDSPQPQINLGLLLPIARTLHFYMRNRDVAGISDLLEDVLNPMAGEWMKGNDGP
jgi:hypothetical protein